MIGDLRVIKPVVAPGVAIDKHRAFAKGRDLYIIVGRIQLEKRREAVDRVPEARDQNEKHGDGRESDRADGPRPGQRSAHRATSVAGGSDRSQIVTSPGCPTASHGPKSLPWNSASSKANSGA